jgi:hypothetical protein
VRTHTEHKAQELSPDARRAVENLLGRRLQDNEVVQISSSSERVAAAPNNGRSILPVWPGGVIGDLRREDIYDDVG